MKSVKVSDDDHGIYDDVNGDQIDANFEALEKQIEGLKMVHRDDIRNALTRVTKLEEEGRGGDEVITLSEKRRCDAIRQEERQRAAGQLKGDD